MDTLDTDIGTDHKKKGVRQDHDLYELILRHHQRSLDYMREREILERAEQYTQMYENNNWDAMRVSRPKHLSKMQVAIGFDVIETGLSVATAQIPMPDIEPEIQNDNQKYQEILALQESDPKGSEKAMENFKTAITEYAQKLQRQLVKTWKQNNMQAMIRMQYREKGKVGTSFLISEWDEENRKIVSDICDITEIFPFPNVSAIEAHNPEPFIYAPVMTLSQVREKFDVEDVEDSARVGLNDLTQFESTERGMSAIVRRGFKILGELVASKLKGDKKGDDYCIPLICWMPDKSTTELYDDFEYEKDEKGLIRFDEQGKQIQVKKVSVEKERAQFPSGYKKVVIIKGHKDWIISEEDSPYQRNGKCCPPVFKLTNYPQAKDFWGISELQMIGDLMMRLMSSASNFNDILRFNGNPVLILPKDAERADVRQPRRNAKNNSGDTDRDALTNDIGAIWKSDAPQLIRYLNMQLGFEIKWWLEWLQNMIDRITHMSDAIRGFNQYSQDSGKKIRELRAAAMGTFQPKLDEQVEFCRELYRHWAWIYQNLYEDTIIQHVPDQFGEARLEEFDPSEGEGVKFNVDVSSMSLLPEDPDLEFTQGKELYMLGQQRTGQPIISAEHLIDLATALRDKARAKNFVKETQNTADLENQKQQSLEQFAKMVQQLLTTQPNTDQEDALFQGMIELIQVVPDLLLTREFKVLPQRVKLAIFTTLTKPEPEVNPAQVQEQNPENAATLAQTVARKMEPAKAREKVQPITTQGV